MTEEFSQRRLVGAGFQLVDLSDASFEQVMFRGARFRSVNLSDATIEHATFKDARFRDVDLRGLRIHGAYLVDVEISGEVIGLRVNGVDVGPLVEAELDRRYPERTKLPATDAAGFREAWAMIEDLWAATVAHARELDPALLHEHVDDEWSFIETLRHLLFATDAWIGRVMLGNPAPWDPLDLPWDQMPDTEGIPRDRSAKPALDVVLALPRRPDGDGASGLRRAHRRAARRIDRAGARARMAGAAALPRTPGARHHPQRGVVAPTVRRARPRRARRPPRLSRRRRHGSRLQRSGAAVRARCDVHEVRGLDHEDLVPDAARDDDRIAATSTTVVSAPIVCSSPSSNTTSTAPLTRYSSSSPSGWTSPRCGEGPSRFGITPTE